MNVLFLTLVKIGSLSERGIFQDLLRKFAAEGHQVAIVTPVERREKVHTNLKEENNARILQVRTFNIQKTNLLEKGIGTLAIEYQYLAAVKKYLSKVRFDLVLYSTPPITFSKVISYIKERDKAYCYLLLKDIFPQNAVDMKMIAKGSLLHRYFLCREKKLYQISDKIGCMSPANVNFLLEHNQDLPPDKVEVNPNSIEPAQINYTHEEIILVRKKYQIPVDMTVFVYGGNLGVPQGIQFLIDTIAYCANRSAFFLVVGNGTEFFKIENFFREKRPVNAKLIQALPKADYDKLLACCDVGMIFLDERFTIPNFPSRLLSYLEMKMPVIAATDSNTDIGDILEEAGCGYKVLSGDLHHMQKVIDQLVSVDNRAMSGLNGRSLLERNYHVVHSYRAIIVALKCHYSKSYI